MGRVERRLGERVAQHRRAAGLTQAQLAERVGVATETVSRLERGTSIPSLSRLDRVATALAVDLAELVRSRVRDHAKEKAIDDVARHLRRRSLEDIETISDVVAKIFARWK